MLIRMTVGTIGPGGMACEVGEVYDLPDPLALIWCEHGRAVVATAPASHAGPAAVQSVHDPVPAVAAPPARRRRA